MKNYSFSNIANEESYATRKNHDFNNYYRHSQLKSSEANQKIEQIKKKYDTPSRRQRLESLKKSKDYDTASRLTHKQQAKENIYEHKIIPSFGNSYLKESISINRLDRSTLKDQQNKQLANGKFQTRDHRRSYEYRQPQPLSLKNMNNMSIKEEQDCIFSKMREMKESLVNHDYMKHSTNIAKSTSNISKYTHQDSAKTQNKRQYDPRVQNIDKINSKIKQILSCLSENQKQQSTYSHSKDNNYNSKEPTFNYQTNKESSKSSAFFGMNNVNFKEISQSKKSYQSHFHRGSDVLEKIDVYDPTSKQNLKTEKTQERLSKNQSYSISKSVLDYQPPRNRDYSINRLDTQKPLYVSKQAQLSKTPNHYANRQYSQMKGLKVSQSKSQIDSIKKSALTANDSNNGVLKSGKKLNDEISKIQKKIQDFEKEKRKLNIQFTPFSSKSNIKSQSNLNTSIRDKKLSEYPQENTTKVENEQNRTLSKNNVGNRSSSYDIKLKTYMNRASVYQQKINQLKINTRFDKQITNYQDNGNNASNSEANHKDILLERANRQKRQETMNFQLKLQQIQVKTVRIQKQFQTNEQNSFNQLQSNRFTRNSNNYNENSNISRNKSQRQSDVDEQFIKKRTDEGMQQRKKRLQQSSQNIIKTQTIKKLVALFCQQVKYDENFRNLKIWFQGCLKKDKNEKLSMLLQKQGIKLTTKQCQKLFSVDESENNPFFSTQGFEGSYQQLIRSYIESQNHWLNQICHKFDKRSLNVEGFTSQKIDLQSKGYIELQDLVRFLNIESGTFYRNRDLFLIFHRFTSMEKMNFQKIIEQISA